MKALVVYCHPNPDSYTAAIRDTVVAKLRGAGVETTVMDLYAQGFDAVLSRDELACYEKVGENCKNVPEHAALLAEADTLIFVYPTWWYGLPATLKGWLDRVLLPGVAFDLPSDGPITPSLQHIKRLAAFTTCGASWWLTSFIGAPGRRTLMRGVGLLCAPRATKLFRAHYKMDISTDRTRTRHLERVGRAMDRLLKTAATAEPDLVATGG